MYISADIIVGHRWDNHELLSLLLHLICLVLLLLLSQRSVLGQITLSPTRLILKAPKIVRGGMSTLLPSGMVSRRMRVCIYHRLIKLNDL